MIELDRIQALPQSTILLDRDGNELFRFFEEDRSRVLFETISPYMVDAIIAVEDQTFWVNNWTDARSFVRAVMRNIQAWYEWSSQLQWGSTITQQVVKNIFLTNTKTIERKMTEIALARRLTRKWYRQIKQNDGLSSSDAYRRTKEEIMSAYLNLIFFGNQAYGIESAARQYFQTTPDQLTLLQSAILAALPQAPTLYNPVRNPEMVLWFWQFSWSLLVDELWEQDDDAVDIILAFEEKFPESTFDWEDGDTEMLQKLYHGSYASPLYDILHQKFSWNFIEGMHASHCLAQLRDRATVEYNDVLYFYNHGRKDWVLCRMLELWMIDEEQFLEAFLDGQNLALHQARFLMRAPHFVWWVHDYFLSLPEIQALWLNAQQIIQNGYVIHTSIDMQKQAIAEESLLNYKTMLRNLGGNNRAMLHIDANNGEVLSYVWSENFYDDTIDGQVDVIQAIRQTGSTLKPFVYAYLFTHYPYTKFWSLVDFPIPWNSPRNHDNMFWWRITLEQALAWSRNLPAVRTFIALWGADVFVPYFQSLWFTWLRDDKYYSYPLVLGADEATMLQLWQAYTQLALTGQTFPHVTPIMAIEDNQWEIIYENPWAVHQKVIPDTVWEMIWSILSNPSAMPTNWRWLRNHPLDHIALKTWTSDIKLGRRSFPRDAWSVLYTPNDVLVSWAWNTDWSAMGSKAFGWEVNFYPLRQYLQWLVAHNAIQDTPRTWAVTFYTQEWFYAPTVWNSLTREQQQWLWRASR